MVESDLILIILSSLMESLICRFWQCLPSAASLEAASSSSSVDVLQTRSTTPVDILSSSRLSSLSTVVPQETAVTVLTPPTPVLTTPSLVLTPPTPVLSPPTLVLLPPTPVFTPPTPVLSPLTLVLSPPTPVLTTPTPVPAASPSPQQGGDPFWVVPV